MTLQKLNELKSVDIRRIEKDALTGSAQCSCFCLNALVVVEVYEIVYELVRLFECSDFLPVNTFCLENGEEIFCHCIVI